jgi:hypothetical protein
VVNRSLGFLVLQYFPADFIESGNKIIVFDATPLWMMKKFALLNANEIEALTGAPESHKKIL